MKRVLSFAVVLFMSCAVLRPVPGGGFTLTPSTAQADPGQVLKLVLSQTPPTVTWTVTGGAIAPDGTFTAPGCTSTLPATITITATSGGTSASATIQVADRVTGVTVTPATVAVPPNGTVKFTALVKTVCNPTGTATAMRAVRQGTGPVAIVKEAP